VLIAIEREPIRWCTEGGMSRESLGGLPTFSDWSGTPVVASRQACSRPKSSGRSRISGAITRSRAAPREPWWHSTGATSPGAHSRSASSDSARL